MGDESGPSNETPNLAAYFSHQKSVVWKYFGIEKNRSGVTQKDKHVLCTLCAQKVAHGGGIANLKNHFIINHQKEYKELFENEDNKTSVDNFVRPSGEKGYYII